MSGTKRAFFDPEELQHIKIKVAFVDPFWFDSSNYFARGKHQDCMLLDAAAYTTAYTSTPKPAVDSSSILEYGILTPERNQVMSRRWRICLSTQQVIDIYTQLPSKTTHTASILAVKYGVTAKAIRDIWTGRTWSDTVGSAKNKKPTHKQRMCVRDSKQRGRTQHTVPT